MPPGDYDYDDMLQGLVATIEGPIDDTKCRIIAGAVAILLGEDGCRGHLKDVREIRARGDIPVLLFLIGGPESVLATSVAIPRPTLH